MNKRSKVHNKKHDVIANSVRNDDDSSEASFISSVEERLSVGHEREIGNEPKDSGATRLDRQSRERYRAVGKQKLDSVITFEETLKELLELAKGQPLRDANDVTRSRTLMCNLRRMDYSSKDIEKLTNGAWKENTIKQYTMGVHVSAPEVKEYISDILVRSINSDTGLADIAELSYLKASLIEHGISFDSVIELAKLVQEISNTSGKIDIDYLVQFIAMLQGRGVTFDRLKQTIEIMAIVTGKEGDLDPAVFERLAHAAKKFGGIANAMQAMGSFGKIQELREEEQKLSKETEQARVELDAVKAELEAGRSALEEYEQLKSMGYNLDYLSKFRNCVTKYGQGSTVPITMMDQLASRFSSLQEIEAEEQRVKTRIVKAENKCKSIELENAAILQSVEYAKQLLFELKLSPDTIQKLVRRAEEYGGLANMLNALGLSRNVENLRYELYTIQQKVSKLQAKEATLVDSVYRLEGECEAFKELLEKQMAAVIDSIKQQSQSAIQELVAATLKQLDVIKKESVKDAETMAKAKHLEMELNLARLVVSALKYPEQAIGLPSEYGYLFVEAARKYFLANNINPQAKDIDQRFLAMHPHLIPIASSGVRLNDLLAFAAELCGPHNKGRAN